MKGKYHARPVSLHVRGLDLFNQIKCDFIFIIKGRKNPLMKHKSNENFTVEQNQEPSRHLIWDLSYNAIQL